MKSINLSTDFNPFPKLPSLEFDSFVFSGGEPHIKLSIENVPEKVIVTTRINCFNDLGLLLVATDALKRSGVENIEAFIPYFPGARQDRIMTKGEALTVKVYADIINAQAYKKVYVFDPHSEVTSALVNNIRVFDNSHLAEMILKDIENYHLIIPDAGAAKKALKLAQRLGSQSVIKCDKEREVSTGKLSEFSVYHDDLKGNDCYIVDDICDGGGTFIGLAKALKEKNAGKLYLVVSHGIFSDGLEKLSRYFELIHTTNSFQKISNNSVRQVDLSKCIAL